MAFKRPGRSTFSIGPFVAGTVAVPRLSTGVQDARTADAIEKMLHRLAVNGYSDLVQQVAEGLLKPTSLYDAELRDLRTGGAAGALRGLRIRKEDPFLRDVVGSVRTRVKDERVKSGLDQLLALTPNDARLSWLTDPENLTDLYDNACKGEDRSGRHRAPNSVRRSLHRAVAEILTRKMGRGRMLAIMAEVKVPSQYDERVVGLTASELKRLLTACDAEVQKVVKAAVLTGVDQGPLLRLRFRDFRDDEQHPTLNIPDTKNAARMRQIPLSLAAAELFRLAALGRSPHESVFDLTYKQLRGRWESARKAASLEHLRFKDLRAVFATAFLEAGGNPKDLQHILGHTTPAMTLRYIRRLPLQQQGSMDATAQILGLGCTSDQESIPPSNTVE